MKNLTPNQTARRVATDQGLTCGPCPLGYTKPKPGDIPKPDPHIAPLLVDAVAQIIEGKSMSAVALWLGEMGVRSSRGNRITRVSLDRIMRSKFWAGYISLHDQHYPGAHEAIITPEMQEDLDEELAHRVGWNSSRGRASAVGADVALAAVDATEGQP